MTIWILAALLLYVLQTLLPGLFRYVLRADPQVLATLGPRDNLPDMSVRGRRAERALRNMEEALLVFLPLALLAPETGTAFLGAQVFVLARIAYLPVYILGVPVLRSAIWIGGVVGLALMALAILPSPAGGV